MAFTTTQLQALEEAIAEGTLKVAFDGREVTYQDTRDLIRAYKLVKSSLQAAGTITKPKRSSVIKRRMS